MTHSSNRPGKLGRVSLWADDRGLSTVEYVIILVLVAVFAIGAWKAFGGTMSDKVKNSTEQIKKM
jgi:Flp pilus assembly pilin Flp